MSLISVYIIAYNDAEKVRATVESALWADEVVVVDSWSTDGTAEVAASLGARPPLRPPQAFFGLG